MSGGPIASHAARLFGRGDRDRRSKNDRNSKTLAEMLEIQSLSIQFFFVGSHYNGEVVRRLANFDIFSSISIPPLQRFVMPMIIRQSDELYAQSRHRVC